MTRPAVPDRQPVVLYAIGAVLLLSGAYLLFELGRYQGGYSLLDQRRERAAAAQALAERDAGIEELRRQITVLETSREIDRETYTQVEDNLSQLQARIQAQEEELAFYQGIVSPDDGVAGLRIQSLEVAPADSERRYVLRIVLVQAIIHDRRVAGVVRLTVMGSRGGEGVELGLGDLVAEGTPGELSYGFRYFQGLQQELVLPVGFEPDRVNVEIWPREPRGEQILQSFQWDAIVT
jgi:hypothetical protein